MSVDPTGEVEIPAWMRTAAQKVEQAAKAVAREGAAVLRGASDAVVNANTIGIAEATGLTNRESGLSYNIGRVMGDGVAMLQGGAEVTGAGGGAVVGLATGPGELVIAPAAAAVAVHGAAVGTAGFVDSLVSLSAIAKGGGSGGNGDGTSPGGLQKKVERGQAPRDVERVDPAHTKTGEPHVHYKDGTSSNKGGSTHDQKGGTPNPPNKTRRWLKENGWTPPPKKD